MVGEGIQLKGWISLHRSIQDHWIWKDADKLKAWLDLLLLANHQEKRILLGNELVTVKRGGYITSQKKLMHRWGWGAEKTRTFLKLLEADGMIKFEPDKKKTVITILNYDSYQNQNGLTLDNSMNSKDWQNENRTQSERDQNDIRTSAETNNNDNNDNNLNNDNKDIYTEALELCKYYGSLLPGQSITAHMPTLKMCIEMYSYEWTKEAMQKTIKNIKRFNPGYMEKILKDWVKNGKEDTHGGTKQDNAEGQGKYTGLKPPAPKITGDIDDTDLI